jgi:hypothetical protein
MARPRLRADRPLSATERVQRFRSQRGEHRLEVLLDLTSFEQVSGFAERWGCSRQEVLKLAFRAVLPAMRRAGSSEELFDGVREALEKAGQA